METRSSGCVVRREVPVSSASRKPQPYIENTVVNSSHAMNLKHPFSVHFLGAEKTPKTASVALPQRSSMSLDKCGKSRREANQRPSGSGHCHAALPLSLLEMPSQVTTTLHNSASIQCPPSSTSHHTSRAASVYSGSWANRAHSAESLLHVSGLSAVKPLTSPQYSAIPASWISLAVAQHHQRCSCASATICFRSASGEDDSRGEPSRPG
ncbi:hypothetical protein B0J14DRAFT_173379 [Halenospora varia]|nr:hypothetical protein B0J14DRAFT_173379 [Halenospora varia]